MLFLKNLSIFSVITVGKGELVRSDSYCLRLNLVPRLHKHYT